MVMHRPPLEEGVGTTTIRVPLGVGRKLPLPLYADARFHIPMTHCIDRYGQSRYNLYHFDWLWIDWQWAQH